MISYWQVTRFRMTLVVLIGLAGLLCLVAGTSTAGKTKKPKLGKEGSYAQTLANGTGVNVFTRGRKVVAVWVVSNYKFDGGAKCWPIGFTGELQPDGSTTGPVHVEVHPKAPVPLGKKGTFTVKPTKSNPFYDNGGGSIKGRLLPSGKLSVTVKLVQSANSLQGRCSTSIKTPKAKFRAFDVDPVIG